MVSLSSPFFSFVAAATVAFSSHSSSPVASAQSSPSSSTDKNNAVQAIVHYDNAKCKGHTTTFTLDAKPGNCLPYPNKKDVWYSLSCAANVVPGGDTTSALRHFYKDSPTCNTTHLILDATEVFFLGSTNCFLASDWFNAESVPAGLQGGVRASMQFTKCFHHL